MRLIPYLTGGLLVFLSCIWAASFAVDASRKPPEKPSTVPWLDGARYGYATIDGIETRYLTAGTGPDLVLLHTFSTELGQFQKVWRSLAEDYTVWALDLPGFGYSDLPDEPLTAAYYADFVSAFLTAFNITEATLAGESIGGTIPLLMSAGGDDRVAKIVALNPIGYVADPLARSTPFASAFSRAVRTPVIGDFVLRIRNDRATRAILKGAVTSIAVIPDAYLAALAAIQKRPEFAGAQKSLLNNSASWVSAVGQFDAVTAATHILWGDQDWSEPDERRAFTGSIAGATSKTLDKTGHFITMDNPGAIIAALKPGN
ncbi:MAG: alpha/beta hydrolase [Pseudomonadota bacterium]